MNAPVVAPSAPTPSRGSGSSGDRRRASRLGATMLGLVLASAVTVAVIRDQVGLAPAEPVVLAPVAVYATLRLDGALVRGGDAGWALSRGRPVRYGDPVPVELTAYCLKGRTRRDRWVRQGIVASDPRVFPLARYLEIYVGRKYWGRFLIDDTGGVIKGNKLDIWTPTCAEARQFGRQRGTAVLVRVGQGARADTLMTGRLGGM